MNGKRFAWELAYYALVLIVYFIVSRDERGDPPLRTTVLYYTYRSSQRLARMFGQLGLSTERAYHIEVEKSRSI